MCTLLTRKGERKQDLVILEITVLVGVYITNRDRKKESMLYKY